MAVQLSQHPAMSQGDADFGTIACDKWLYRISPVETIASVDAIVAHDVIVVDGVWTAGAVAAEVTISSAAPSIAALSMFQRTVAIGKAIQFAISGQTAGKDYIIRYTVTTSSGRTRVRDVKMSVAA